MSSVTKMFVRGVLEQILQDEQGCGDGLSEASVGLIKRTPAQEASEVVFVLIGELSGSSVQLSSTQREVAGECLASLLPKIDALSIAQIASIRDATRNIPNARLRTNLHAILKRVEFRSRHQSKKVVVEADVQVDQVIIWLAETERTLSRHRFTEECIKIFLGLVPAVETWIAELENTVAMPQVSEKQLCLLLNALFITEKIDLAFLLILKSCRVITAGKPWSYGTAKLGIQKLSETARWADLHLLLWLIEPVRLRNILSDALGGNLNSSDLYLYLPSLERVNQYGVQDKVVPKVFSWFESRMAHQDWFTYNEWSRIFSKESILGPLAEKLIWQFDNRATSVIWRDGDWMNCENKRFIPPNDFRLTVWHPALSRPDQILEWQRFFIQNEIKQPIRQVFREVYSLPLSVQDDNEDIQQFRERVNFKKFLVLMRPLGWSLEVTGYNTWPGFPFKEVIQDGVGGLLVIVPEDITSRQFPDFAQIEELFIVDADGIKISPNTLALPVMSDLLREVDFLVRSCSAHIYSDDEYELGGLGESPGQIMRENVLNLLAKRLFETREVVLDKSGCLHIDAEFIVDLRGRQVWSGDAWSDLPRKSKSASNDSSEFVPYDDALISRALKWLCSKCQ